MSTSRPIIVLTGERQSFFALIERITLGLKASGQYARSAEWRGRAVQCAGEEELFELAYEYVEIRAPGYE